MITQKPGPEDFSSEFDILPQNTFRKITSLFQALFSSSIKKDIFFETSQDCFKINERD